ncbi:MAG: DUF2280 domain-containing protein [Sphaerobacter sp.]|nr:DUF2280 domain-containing protein [Sphaerobacter sp.]
MARLSEEVKTFIVQRLACYDTPQQVADAVREEFGLDVDRRQVQTYDPERTGKKPSAKWCAIFEATRKKFLEEIDAIPIANKAVRLRRLDRMAREAERRGNYVLTAQLLEQAAKETGGVYTNRRELTGRDGGPIETRDTSLDNLTDAELAALAREIAESFETHRGGSA